MNKKPALDDGLTRPAARRLPSFARPLLRRGLVRMRSVGLDATDLVVCSFPKSGSTWVRFVLADALRSDGGASFDTIDTVSPPLGAHRRAPEIIPGGGRLVKSHESRRDTGAYPARTLYIVRDGRDVALSLYHFLRRVEGYDGTFDDYLPYFLDGRIGGYGSWSDHVMSWISPKTSRGGKVALVRYEDLLSDGASVLVTALAELQVSVTLDSITAAMRANGVDEMRKKEKHAGEGAFRSGNAPVTEVPFVREGTSGQWREEMPSALIERFSARAGTALVVGGYPLS